MSRSWNLWISDGSRFLANSITLALQDETGQLKGYARVVRDFTDRHERDEKLRNDGSRLRQNRFKRARTRKV
jgi:hypothetical protein